MSRPVICAIEDWEGGAGAAHIARELARNLELPLLYIHVVESGRGEEGAREAFGLLRHMVETSPGVLTSSAIEEGHPADRIVAIARRTNAAYVVVGCRGPRSSLLGSVSADVSRRAPCPVMVVPPAAVSALGPARDESPFVGGIVRFDLGRRSRQTPRTLAAQRAGEHDEA